MAGLRGWRRSPATDPGEGIEISPALAADGTLALLHSDAHVPMRPAVVSSNGAIRDLAPNSSRRFPAGRLVTPRQVIFSAADGMQIHGQLFLPHLAHTRSVIRRLSFFMEALAARCFSAGITWSTTPTRMR